MGLGPLSLGGAVSKPLAAQQQVGPPVPPPFR
jgi:hypothetical protein